MRPKSTDYIATEAEALTLLETILSSREEGSSKRIYLPRVRLCCAECGQEFIVMGYQFHKEIHRQKFYGEYETKFLPAIRRYLAQMDALSSTSKSPTATTSSPMESSSTTAS